MGSRVLHNKCVYKRVDISILVMGGASDAMGYDKRSFEVSNVPLQMKRDTTSME